MVMSNLSLSSTEGTSISSTSPNTVITAKFTLTNNTGNTIMAIVPVKINGKLSVSKNFDVPPNRQLTYQIPFKAPSVEGNYTVCVEPVFTFKDYVAYPIPNENGFPSIPVGEIIMVLRYVCSDGKPENMEICKLVADKNFEAIGKKWNTDARWYVYEYWLRKTGAIK